MHTVSIRQECTACGKGFVKDITPDEYGRWVKSGKPTKSKCNACPASGTISHSDDGFVSTIASVVAAEASYSDSSVAGAADASASCAADAGSSGGD